MLRESAPARKSCRLGGRWVERVHRQGDGLVAAAVVWGAAAAAFGISGNRLWLGVLLLATAGDADIVGAIVRATRIQREVPPRRAVGLGINFLLDVSADRYFHGS